MVFFFQKLFTLCRTLPLGLDLFFHTLLHPFLDTLLPLLLLLMAAVDLPYKNGRNPKPSSKHKSTDPDMRHKNANQQCQHTAS